MRKILLGNEAIVQGALEAGVDFVSVYPGTPSSEIGNVFYRLAEKNRAYFEFSTNEKVALEAAVGAGYSGLKCLVAMKNFGMNVALDALLPFVYTGVKGPTVIVVADDPSCHSSGQSEENSRGFAYLAHIPVLEPSDAQEAKDFVKLGFEISEKFKIPVIIRTTTRVAHQRMPVEITKSEKRKAKNIGKFVKDVHQFVTMPPRVLEMKDELLEKIEKIRAFAEKSSTNKVLRGRASQYFQKLGIVVSGVSYLYVMEILKEFDLDIPVLKLGFFYPLTEKKIKNFIRKLDKVLIVEELEPYLEKEIKMLARENNCDLKILGKDACPVVSRRSRATAGVLPITGELNSEKVGFAISKLINKKLKIGNSLKIKNCLPCRPSTQRFECSVLRGKLKINKRYPRLCPGCPYWNVFAAVKKAAPKGTIFGGDIGCYMIAGFPPNNIQDYLSCMGSSIGIAHGIKKVSQQKLIAFIGDSTFFHAGIPALINTVNNKSNPLIVVMDNRITAMTGHQPRPGGCDSWPGEKTCQEFDIEKIVRACGVKNVRTVNPVNIKEFEQAVKSFLNKKDVSVIIARQMCAYWARKIGKKQ